MIQKRRNIAITELTDCLGLMLSSDLSWLLTESLSSSSELDESSPLALGRFIGSGTSGRGTPGRVLKHVQRQNQKQRSLIFYYRFTIPLHTCDTLNYSIMGTVNSNTVDSKFHLIQSFCKIFARFLLFHV